MNGYSGSSPLARGTLAVAIRAVVLVGLIPARAGNTEDMHAPYGYLQAHPRSRGEHGCLLKAGNAAGGSSPLARGTLTMARRLKRVWGLIPARAGNTRSCRVASWVKRGSSPLARGTHLVGWLRLPPGGLIPARAGNTRSFFCLEIRHRAHPRSRGEHAAGTLTGKGKLGSSPLARGTQIERRVTSLGAGLIPARAGNTPNLSAVFL